MNRRSARRSAPNVHPDGQRFLMIRAADAGAGEAEPERPRIDVVLNWFEELERRVPVE